MPRSSTSKIGAICILLHLQSSSSSWSLLCFHRRRRRRCCCWLCSVHSFSVEIQWKRWRFIAVYKYIFLLWDRERVSTIWSRRKQDSERASERPTNRANVVVEWVSKWQGEQGHGKQQQQQQFFHLAFNLNWNDTKEINWYRYTVWFYVSCWLSTIHDHFSGILES